MVEIRRVLMGYDHDKKEICCWLWIGFWTHTLKKIVLVFMRN